jgi:hypothetical protein
VRPPLGGVRVLEIASGTGQHGVFFAPELKPIKWLPSEVNPLLQASILAWENNFPSDNLFPPLELDVQKSVWSVENPDLKLPFCLQEFPITALEEVVTIVELENFRLVEVIPMPANNLSLIFQKI